MGMATTPTAASEPAATAPASGTTNVVVVGYGMAGARLVDELRSRNAGQLHVTAIGADSSGAYNRILLSNVLAGVTRSDAIRLGPRELAGVGYEVRIDTSVESIDRAAKKVVTDQGVLSYDVLVLATGSTAFVPPIPGMHREGSLLPGVFAFRTLRDCDEILVAAGASRRAIVLGGGLLGLEAARGLAGRGLEVKVLHNTGHVMDRQLDADAGDVLAASLRDLGVEVVTNAATVRVHGDERVTGIELADGTLLDTDLLVVATGVRPEVALAVECGLAVDRAVVVGDDMRTVTDPDVFAIGECSQHDGQVYGLVAPAWEQAKVVADVITGTDPAARYTGSRLVTRLKAKGVELAAMGETEGCEHTEVIRFSDPARRVYKKLLIKDGRVTGAILLGDTATAGSVTQLFDRGAKAPADPLPLLFTGLRRADAEVVADPAHIPDRATVCSCNSVTKGQITACWLAGARSVAGIAAGTRATTGCGGCTDTVKGLVDWLRASDPEPQNVTQGAS